MARLRQHAATLGRAGAKKKWDGAGDEERKRLMALVRAAKEGRPHLKLFRVVAEQQDAIHQLRLLVGALMWMVSKGEPQALAQINEMIWRIDAAKPKVGAEGDALRVG